MGYQKEPHIQVGQQGQMDGSPVFYVRDNGMGIAPEDRDRVFTLFGRGATTGREGHGIGLATCARIVQRHRGSLRVVDADGPGTVIELELPGA
jgi:signal transduction histidine kinase